MNNNLDKYTHTALDVDNSEYLVTNAEVQMYKKGINSCVDAVLRHFSQEIDNSVEVQLFIKGNRLFFTVDGVKYWHILTCWANEWHYVEQIEEALSHFAEDIAYKFGELD